LPQIIELTLAEVDKMTRRRGPWSLCPPMKQLGYSAGPLLRSQRLSRPGLYYVPSA